MADVQEPHSAFEEQEDKGNTELDNLKMDFEGYRELLLPLNKVLEWEQNHYPAILVGAITLLFAVIWYMEPSVLTTFSLIGLSLSTLDFAVPLVSAYLFKSSEWTIVEERQFEAICIRTLNAKTHFLNFKTSLAKLKAEKPKAYLVVMMGVFATLAWIGSLIDNLLLTYLLVVFVVLVPGLRKHGILQKATKNVTDVVARFMKSATSKAKATTKAKSS